MLRKTIVPFLACFLMLTLAQPLAATPVDAAGPGDGISATIVDAVQSLWEWTVARVVSTDESEQETDNPGGDEADDPPIANAFPGYEPVG